MFQTTNQDIWLSLRQSNMEMDTSPFLDDSSHSTSISCQFEDGNAATVGSRAKHHPSARFRPSFPSNKNSLLENAFHTMDDHNPQIWWYVLGGWPTPLKNMSSSVRMIIPNIWKNEKCSKPPTRELSIAMFDYRRVPISSHMRACSQPLKHAAAIRLREIWDKYRALQKDAQLPHQGKMKSWICPIINQRL